MCVCVCVMKDWSISFGTPACTADLYLVIPLGCICWSLLWRSPCAMLSRRLLLLLLLLPNMTPPSSSSSSKERLATVSKPLRESSESEPARTVFFGGGVLGKNFLGKMNKISLFKKKKKHNMMSMYGVFQSYQIGYM